MPNYKLYNSSNLPILKELKANSVDAVITDTPYGTDKGDWDQIPSREQMVQTLRVCKPGAYMVAFGAPRTSHKLMTSIEQAGWEIKDMLCWLYGSGFSPGSMSIAKNIDALYGEEGQVENGVYQPVSDEAKEFAGYGIGLKPAWEPIILARKPSSLTVAENLVTHGVGALDVESAAVVDDVESPTDAIAEFRQGSRKRRRVPGQTRWPANVAMDEDAGLIVDKLQPGASRFFYCGKTSSSEREAGLVEIDATAVAGRSGVDVVKRNTHPTVKPIALMRWLTRLIAPIGSVVLDPWMGSGSTGCGVGQEGERLFIGIEMMTEYYKIAEARIAHWWI